MAEAITFPSPSAFMRPTPPSDPKDNESRSGAQKHARKKSTTTTGWKKKAGANNKIDTIKHKTGYVDRPKQSKSRNGTLLILVTYALVCLPKGLVQNFVNA